jgi:hypothetical protein
LLYQFWGGDGGGGRGGGRRIKMVVLGGRRWMDGLIMDGLLYSSYHNEGDRASQNFSVKLEEDSKHGLSYIAFTNLSSSQRERKKERE